MTQADVELRATFNWSGGYDFDVLIKNLEQGFQIPSSWWFVGGKWSGFRMGPTFHLHSAFDGQVSADDTGYLFEIVALDHTVGSVILPANVSARWDLSPTASSLTSATLSWGDFATSTELEKPPEPGPKKGKNRQHFNKEGGWYIEGGFSGDVAFENDLTFKAFDTTLSIEVGAFGRAEGQRSLVSKPWNLRFDGLRVPALGWAYVPPGVLDLALVGEVQVGIGGKLAVTGAADPGTGLYGIRSAAVAPRIFADMKIGPEFQLLGRGKNKVGSAGLRIAGDFEQGLNGSYAFGGGGWSWTAPGSCALRAELYAVLNAGKKRWDATLLTKELKHLNWDLLAKSGEAPSPIESVVGATKKLLTRLVRGWW
jgi:hypothetical protein